MGPVVWEELARDGPARMGELVCSGGGSRRLPTPAALVATRRGLPARVTPELDAHLTRGAPAPTGLGFHLCATHYMESAKAVEEAGGAAPFAGGHALPTLCTLRDPAAFELDLKPAGTDGPHVMTVVGLQQLTATSYAALVRALRPDAWVALGEEHLHAASLRKAQRAVDRTTEWAAASEAAAAGLDALVLWPVVGGRFPEERRRSAVLAAERGAGAGGFALCGLGTGEARDARLELIRAAVEPLPPGRLRYAAGLGLPEEVLDAVAAGVDLFDGTYPVTCTNGGYALCFPLAPPAGWKPGQPAGAACVPDAARGSDGSKLNMRAVCFRKDGLPMIPGCTCFACTQHSRSYIHHLVMTHELLGEVLLEAHNAHHYAAFFEEMRAAIKAGTFERFRAWHLASAEARLTPDASLG